MPATAAASDKLLDSLKAYIQLEDIVRASGVQIGEQMFDRRQELREALEALPIHWDDIRHPRRPVAFVLTAGEWWPCSAARQNERNSWLEYRIDYKDGSCESGVAAEYQWAQCTADDTVNFHWLDRDEDAEIEAAKFTAAIALAEGDGK